MFQITTDYYSPLSCWYYDNFKNWFVKKDILVSTYRNIIYLHLQNSKLSHHKQVIVDTAMTQRRHTVKEELKKFLKTVNLIFMQ